VNSPDVTLDEPALITRTVGVATVSDHSAVGVTTVEDARHDLVHGGGH
jgi:hypothetical protein